MSVIGHGEKCYVKSTMKSALIEAVVMQFTHEKKLVVVLNQSIKLSMIWNGQCYEGRGAGLDFESAGPEIIKSQTGNRK